MAESILRLLAVYLTIAALATTSWPAIAQPGAIESIPSSVAPTCPPDADLSGLIDAASVTSGKLKGLDKEVVTDLVAIIASYRSEREHLCEALAQLSIKEDVAQQAREMAEAIAQTWEADANKCHAALQTVPIRRRWPLGWTAGVGVCLADDSELKATGGVLWGFQW